MQAHYLILLFAFFKEKEIKVIENDMKVKNNLWY